MIVLEEIPNLLIEYDGPENKNDCWGLYYYFSGCCYKGLNDFVKARDVFQVLIFFSYFS